MTEQQELHNGIDIAVPEGTHVLAMQDGVVRIVGEDAASGVYLRYETENGFMISNAHLSKVLAREGDKVRQGQTVAFSGNTGLSTGPHVHLTMRRNDELLNPMNYVDLPIADEQTD